MNKTKLLIMALAVIVIATAAYIALDRLDDPAGNDDDGTYTYQTYEYGGKLITQSIDDIPERVIVGNVAALEMMLEFDLGDRIVALMYYDLFYDTNCVTPHLQERLDEVKERIGEENIFYNEGMSQAYATTLQPDLIFGYVSAFGDDEDATLGSVGYWNDLGCACLSMRTQAKSTECNIDGFTTDYNILGDIFDVREETDRFVEEYKGTLDDLADAEFTATCIELDDATSFYSYGEDSFPGFMVTESGGTYKFTKGSHDKSELVNATDLDVIILVVFSSSDYESLKAQLMDDTTLAYVPAVQEGKIILKGLSGIYGGPGSLETLKELAEMVSG